MIDPANVLKEHVEATLRGADDKFCDCCHMIWPCDAYQLAKALQASNDWNLTLFRRCESAKVAGVMAFEAGMKHAAMAVIAFEAGVKLAGWRDHWRDYWRETNDARGRWIKRAEAAEKRLRTLERQWEIELEEAQELAATEAQAAAVELLPEPEKPCADCGGTGWIQYREARLRCECGGEG